MPRLTIGEKSFLLDGAPFRILSGATHYFRVRPEYWRDRMRKMKQMGLNAVESYVCWNLHEPEQGRFDFSGALDIARYLKIAQEEGLLAILRPGPYICAEWDFGGLPWHLLRDPEMRLRCMNKPFLEATRKFFKRLFDEVRPMLASNGGPTVMVQVENEYGSYGNDSEYLKWLLEEMKANGAEELFFAGDGPRDWMLQGGSIPGLLQTANFGSHPELAFEELSKRQPGAPLMCSEFWDGWFDHWGEQRHRRTPEDAALALDKILELGGSVNIYMFHGGTSYGFMAGANCANGEYQPTVGSYDYDAPLDEAGDPTPKYEAFKKVIAKYAAVSEESPLPSPKKAYGKVEFSEIAIFSESLDALCPKPIRSAMPKCMEDCGQGYGVILYRARVIGPRKDAALEIRGLADRAAVMIDGVRAGTLSRAGGSKELKLDIPEEGARLDLLVEAMGRINYGPEMMDRKGINGGVTLNGQQYVCGWTIRPMPLDDLTGLSFKKSAIPAGPLKEPVFLRASFEIAESPCDSFLNLRGFGKGLAWLNGFNLGRHWECGPQRTHFIAAPLLRRGVNEIILLEFDSIAGAFVEFSDKPDLG